MRRGPVCPYCGEISRQATGDELYPHRRDLYAKRFWICDPCDAWVGCHPGTETPLGRLANADLRKAKQRAHAAFDPIWKTKKLRRSEAYAWLSGALGLPREECHIGMFDEAMCARVVEVCRSQEIAT